VPQIDDGTSFDDARSLLLEVELHVSPASQAQHSQDPTMVVRSTHPRGGSNVPTGAYVDLDLRAL
jgi:beta-lactam-binding protein with PASTA domain